MTIAITTGRVGANTIRKSRLARRGRERRRRPLLRRILIITGCTLFTLLGTVAAFAGYTLYRIDHDVHHVGVPASLLAKGKNDLLAIVKGPDHSEQIFVFHAVDGHTNVLKVPSSLQLPQTGGRTVRIETLSLHAPVAIIAGLGRAYAEPGGQRQHRAASGSSHRADAGPSPRGHHSRQRALGAV